MRRSLLLSSAALALAACHPPGPPPGNQQGVAPETPAMKALAPRPVQLKAPDGATVYGTYYPADNAKALILLFHQAGSSQGEYVSIAPRLVREGYAALAIDQRVGGTMYGINQTAAGIRGTDREEGKDDYLSALPDMEAALDWAKANGEGRPVILWGSSYSAGLVFLVGASSSAKGVVKAIVAYSPGEYFDDKNIVEAAAAKISVPVFVDQATKDEEIAESKAIIGATKSTDRLQFTSLTGIHGSSTLISAKNPGGADEHWKAVLGFLKRIAP